MELRGGAGFLMPLVHVTARSRSPAEIRRESSKQWEQCRRGYELLARSYFDQIRLEKLPAQHALEIEILAHRLQDKM